MAKAKKHGDFSFLGETIPPSSRRVIELEAAKLYTDSPLSIPIEVLHGASPGPVLMINAAIHGDELNGVEIIRQLLNTLDEKTQRHSDCGAYRQCFRFIHKSRYLPDRRDLNRCFPGSEKGSLASRMAHTFFPSRRAL